MTFKLADNEKWIAGYEGSYSVDTEGNVWSYKRTPRRKLTQYINIKNYPCVTLNGGHSGKAYTVHRLVADTFLPNPNKYNIIKHIDLDRSNNNVKNLEWVADIKEIYPYWESLKAAGVNTYELFQVVKQINESKGRRYADGTHED